MRYRQMTHRQMTHRQMTRYPIGPAIPQTPSSAGIAARTPCSNRSVNAIAAIVCGSLLRLSSGQNRAGRR